MRTIAYSSVAILALLMGIAAGWTWQQWQPTPGLPAAGVIGGE